MFVYLKDIQGAKTCKNVQKRAKTSKNVHLKYLFIKKRAPQGRIYQKMCNNVQKHASQMFLDPFQKRAWSRSVHLEAVYLEALLYYWFPWHHPLITQLSLDGKLDSIIFLNMIYYEFIRYFHLSKRNYHKYLFMNFS